jgi:hypothetical protein
MKKFLYLLALPLVLSCKKDDANGPVKIRLTDAPAEFKEVNIDLLEVQVKTKKGGWEHLVTNPGIYNLLAYQNNVDTLIATGSPSDYNIQEIRLILGSNNSVTLLDDQVRPLTIPSGSESGLKIKISDKYYEGPYDFLIDFDALQSIEQKDGSYKLRPVIRLK